MRSRGPNVRGKGGTNLKVLTHYFSKNVILIILSIWVIIRITSLLYDLNYREDNLLRREGWGSPGKGGAPPGRVGLPRKGGAPPGRPRGAGGPPKWPQIYFIYH